MFQRGIQRRVCRLEETKKQATMSIQTQAAALATRVQEKEPDLTRRMSAEDLTLADLPEKRCYLMHPEESFHLSDTYFLGLKSMTHERVIKPAYDREKELVLAR